MSPENTAIHLSTTPPADDSRPRTIAVWDLPTRIFHWSFAAFVILAFATSEVPDALVWVHVYSGTMLIGFVAFRAIWGVIGSRHAQFGDFVQGPETVTAYAKSLASFRPPHSVGHNPLGGWMVLALLVVVLLASLTGMMVSKHGYVGPLAHIGGGLFGEAHEGLGSFVIVLVGVHVLGVVGHSLISRENLIRSMINGLKTVPAGVKAVDIKPVGIVRPVIALAVGMAVVLYFMR